MVATALSWKELSAININAPLLPGVHTEIGGRRMYKHGNTMGRIVGYIGGVERFALDDDPIVRLPRARDRQGWDRAWHGQPPARYLAERSCAKSMRAVRSSAIWSRPIRSAAATSLSRSTANCSAGCSRAYRPIAERRGCRARYRDGRCRRDGFVADVQFQPAGRADHTGAMG